ncbi:SAM-dependent methyltransferase [candidate division LCP-89 bacterium B3_LCP]|uniref:SAM-dependent methyltransferase n=1 Tax=candidate division LCP-89 bacterium B3_LCP TaxID=2012998 RepID=A0A532UYR6_UNCL8|nr:MAG: SAM-dependent methyltransferase [candidate division LCP-89 bacterium B3_LCP]
MNGRKSLRNTAWYHHWFGADYLQLYQHRSAGEAERTIAWLVGAIGLSPPAKVLDLACGNGRHSVELEKWGFTTYGLDLSWPLLINADSPGNSSGIVRTRGDMRCLPFADGSFNLILSLFTSFGYFSLPEEDNKVLGEVSRCLSGGGFYVLDFLNATVVREEIIPSEEAEIDGKKVDILRWVDDRNERIEKRILIHERDGALREYRESVRLYSRDKLIDMMNAAGISVKSVYGDYTGSAFEDNSPRLIIIGRKNA